jgi:hypothetical protein
MGSDSSGRGAAEATPVTGVEKCRALIGFQA